jgi:hypothetical protein
VRPHSSEAGLADFGWHLRAARHRSGHSADRCQSPKVDLLAAGALLSGER